jgi:hypothetical protein
MLLRVLLRTCVSDSLSACATVLIRPDDCTCSSVTAATPRQQQHVRIKRVEQQRIVMQCSATLDASTLASKCHNEDE